MKSILKALFSFLLSVILSMVVLEVFISSTYIAEKSNNDVYEDIGRGRRANFQYVKFGEGFSAGWFNQYRYMGPAYPKEKNQGTLRIALLGDSFVEGFQVFDRSHFRKLLEDELKEMLNSNVEVLNFGRSGYDIADMYCYNETFVSEFNPDLSLYFIANADLTPFTTDPLRLSLKYVNDSLVVSKDFPPEYIRIFNETKVLIQHSAILDMLNNCRKVANAEGVWPILLDKLYPVYILEPGLENKFVLPAITIEIINNMNPEKDIIVNRDFKDLEYTFVDLLQEKDIKIIYLNDTIQLMKEEGVDPNYWTISKKHGHWNHYGHQAVAKFVADRLQENELRN